MGLIVAITLVATLLLSVPVGLALGLSALAGLLYVSTDFLIVLPQKFLAGLDSFPLLAIPLFVLAGTLMSEGGFAQRIVDMALVFVGRIRGGLGLVVIFSTMLFSGISGSPSANTAAIGSVALPEMKQRSTPRLSRPPSSPPREASLHSFRRPSTSLLSVWWPIFRLVACLRQVSSQPR